MRTSRVYSIEMRNLHELRKRQLGAKIQELRKRNGFSQDSFALKIGRTSAHLSKIERGEKNPSLELLYKIADQLKLPISELFADEELSTNSDEFRVYVKQVEAMLKTTSLNKAKLIVKIAALIHDIDQEK